MEQILEDGRPEGEKLWLQRVRTSDTSTFAFANKERGGGRARPGHALLLLISISKQKICIKTMLLFASSCITSEISTFKKKNYI